MNDLITVNRLITEQDEFANAIIESKGGQLPATIEEIIPVLAFSKARMEAYKALSDAAQKVSEQQELNEAALASGQRWGIVHLYGQKRLGEITKPMPTNEKSGLIQYRRDRPDAPGKRESLKEKNVSEKQYLDAERIAANPEILDRVIAKAQEEGDIPTKTGVLREIKFEKEKERKAAAVAEGRTQKADLEYRIEEQEVYIFLESTISRFPKIPENWNEEMFNRCRGLANIIINRLEVFNG